MQKVSPPDTMRLMTVADVADILQVSIRTIRRLIASGDIKVIRIGSTVRISQTALNEYVTAAAGE